MRSAYVAKLGLAAILAMVPIACDDEDDKVAAPTSTPTPPPTATGNGKALLRFAHLSPNKPPIDICVAVHGTGQFNGPLLKPAGVAAIGLAYGQVSRYFTMDPNSYDVRVVDGGATSCAQSLFDATALAPLAANQGYTVIGTGLIPPQPGNPNAFTMVSYRDDLTGTSGKTAIRFTHVAPATPALDFGFGSGSSFSAQADNVAYLASGSGPAHVDANNYYTIDSGGAPTTFSVRVHGNGGDTVSVSTAAAQSSGATVTFYAIGSLTPMPKPLQLLVCSDNGAVSGAFSPCQPLP